MHPISQIHAFIYATIFPITCSLTHPVHSASPFFQQPHNSSLTPSSLLTNFNLQPFHLHALFPLQHFLLQFLSALSQGSQNVEKVIALGVSHTKNLVSQSHFWLAHLNSDYKWTTTKMNVYLKGKYIYTLFVFKLFRIRTIQMLETESEESSSSSRT